MFGNDNDLWPMRKSGRGEEVASEMINGGVGTRNYNVINVRMIP